MGMRRRWRRSSRGGGLKVALALSGLVVAHNGGGASWDDVYTKGGEHAMDHSVVRGGSGNLIPGEGLVRADPQVLAAPAPGGWEDADLHLALTSPAVDLWAGVAPDADGSVRDAGIFGGPQGDEWDVDADGIPAWYWPGAWDTPPADVDAAVRATHTAFDLDSDEVEAVVYGGTGR